MNSSQIYAHWRGIADHHRPLLVEGHGITPRHRLVQQAELRCSVLWPEVPIYSWYLVERDLLSVVVVRRKARDSNPERH